MSYYNLTKLAEDRSAKEPSFRSKTIDRPFYRENRGKMALLHGLGTAAGLNSIRLDNKDPYMSPKVRRLSKQLTGIATLGNAGLAAYNAHHYLKDNKHI